MAKLRRVQVMLAQEMVDRAASIRQVAGQLGVDESTLRYRLGRPADAPDGRRDRPSVLAGWDERIDTVLIEVRGTARHVVVLAEGEEVARHARHSAARLLLVPTHYDGASTATVTAPTPIGRRAALQLAGLSGLPSPARVSRPLGEYVHLVDVLVGAEARR